MPSFDYASAALTAQSLIRQFGGPVTLVRPGALEGPSHAKEPTPSIELSMIGVRLGTKLRDSTGRLTGQYEDLLYISTETGVTPMKGDKVKLDSATYEIREIRPLAPVGVVVYWEAVVGQ